MTVKTLIHPSGGVTVKLGRNRPKAPAPKLRLCNYVLGTLPKPPDIMDYTAKPHDFLAEILGNDNAGDCTCAAAFHIQGALIANADVRIPSDLDTASALKMYYHLTGGADSGLDEQVVFNHWQAHGLANEQHKISQRVFIDASNEEEVKTALWLFENLYITAELPDAWIDPFPTSDGFTWGLAGDPNPDNGHAFPAFAYNGGVKIDTWGLLGMMPMSSLAYYATPKNGGGCYSVLSAEAINKASGKISAGFNFAQLTADVQHFQT